MELLLDFILIGGIVVTALILILLIKSKERQLPQTFLILFFSILLAYLLNGYADFHDIDFLYVVTFPFSDCIEMFLGPLIFIYIRSLFEDHESLFRRYWTHFVPTILYVLFITIPFLLSLLLNRYVFDYLEYLNEHSEVAVIFLMAYLIGYIICSLELFHTYRGAMLSNFSTIDAHDFNWVRHMLIGTLVVSIIDLSVSIYELYIGGLSWDTQYITGSLVIVLIGYLGYYGVNQSKILLPDFLVQEKVERIRSRPKINQLSHFTPTEIADLETRLKTILHTEKSYLDEDLTLGKLAQSVGTTDKKLSTLLNQHMNTTFYDLINKYRVEAVKARLASTTSRNLTLLGIAFECGFKSKTSFNRIFKKETGLSPSEYRKKC